MDEKMDKMDKKLNQIQAILAKNEKNATLKQL